MPPTTLDQLKSLLRQNLRVTLNDGRILLGMFCGTDKQLNIIITNAEEYRYNEGEEPTCRFVGQVMVPWKFVVKIEAQLPPQYTDMIGGGGRDSGYGALYL
ncbi:hypothetical protein BDQ17DRAFT_1351164 [Cyathus striatus]|nr:hypothetical protein BDQ17DRAFT_1351164 [Cyathus striatus]